MTLTAFRSLLFASFVATTSCVADPQPPVDPDGEVVDAPDVLTAEIGPEGGEIVGPADTIWAGVHLKVPAGALAATTTITIEAIVDPTPLANDAERVGPQFRITPAAIALAAPVELTVPFDHALRDAFDVPDDDCRVWYRDGDGWSNATQIASTPDTVTVRIDRFTTVAAGVLASPVKKTCPDCNPIPECLAGSGFCISQLAVPTAAIIDLESITVVDRVVYYVTNPATNTFTIAKYDTTTIPATQTRLVALAATPTAPVKVRGAIAVESPNAVWAGLTGYGNVRFRGDAPASRNDTDPATVPFGVVIDPILDEPLRLIGNTVSVETTPGVPASRVTFQRVKYVRGVNRPVEVTTTDANADFFALRRNVPYVPPFQPQHVPWFAFRTGDRKAGEFSPGFTSRFTTNSAHTMTVSRSFEYAFADGPSDQPRVVRNRIDGDGLDDAIVPARPTSMAYDDRGNLYIVNSVRPELYIIAPDGGLATLALTNAADGTTEYAQRTPRAIRYVPETDSLLLFTGPTSGRRVFELKNLPD
jgi:hypothetical protein